jgi:hypothetical protein
MVPKGGVSVFRMEYRLDPGSDIRMKRRSLVLTTESARHPFRASLPPHVFLVPKEETPLERDVRERREYRAEIIGDVRIVLGISACGLLMAWMQNFGS